MKTRRGSISLLLLLLLAALLPVLHLHLIAAGRRLEDQALTLAMQAQVRVALAAYDKNLQHHYGLFGLRPEKIDRSVFAASFSPQKQAPEFSLEFRDPLSDPSVLKGQVTSLMRPRLPSLYLEKTLQALATLSQSDKPAADALSQAQNYLAGIDRSEALAARDNLFGGALFGLEDALFQEIASIYRRQASDFAGASQCEFFGNLPDFFDPGSLAMALSRFDQMFEHEGDSAIDRLLLGEYVLGSFPSAVTVRRSGGSTQAIYSLNQTPMHELPAWRDRQVEQILTGFQASSAAIFTRGVIVSMRAALHLAETVSDRQAMTVLRGLAVPLSGLIAAVTAGSLVIDPEVLTWLIAVAFALRDGYHDSERLLSGHAVSLWPDDSLPTPALFYDDHLRLFLYAMPEDLLLVRVYDQIRSEQPGPYYTAVGLQTRHRQKDLYWQEGYP